MILWCSFSFQKTYRSLKPCSHPFYYHFQPNAASPLFCTVLLAYGMASCCTVLCLSCLSACQVLHLQGFLLFFLLVLLLSSWLFFRVCSIGDYPHFVHPKNELSVLLHGPNEYQCSYLFHMMPVTFHCVFLCIYHSVTLWLVLLLQSYYFVIAVTQNKFQFWLCFFYSKCIWIYNHNSA